MVSFEVLNKSLEESLFTEFWLGEGKMNHQLITVVFIADKGEHESRDVYVNDCAYSGYLENILAHLL